MTDMTDQQMKFMAMLGDRDYDTVGVALLWALKHELGDSFTPELSESWQELYGLVAAVMRRAAGRAQSAV